MSSRAHYRCSDEPTTQKWESSKTHIHPDHRDPRKDHIYNTIVCLFADATQLLALPVAASCARIIQNYTPVRRPAPLSSATLQRQRVNWTRTTHSLKSSAIVKFIRIRVEDNLSELLRNLPKNEALRGIAGNLSSLFSRLGIAQLLSDPPPPLFFAACLCLAWAVSLFRQSHSADRYQDRILSGGVAIGMLVAAVRSEGFLMDVKGYLAWSVVLASAISVALHRVLSFWAGPKTKEKPVQAPDLDTKSNGN